MNGFFKMRISDKNMSKTMYALLMTNAKLKSSFHLGLNQYSRRQNSGNSVDILIEIADDKVTVFERLSGINLKTSKEFQGDMVLNNKKS